MTEEQTPAETPEDNVAENAVSAENDDAQLAAADELVVEEASQPCELIGVGAAIVDWLLDVDDAFLTEHVPGAKGGMEMVETIDPLHGWIETSGKEAGRAAGGAAANTTVGCANLGINAGFMGAIGNDDIGAFFHSELERQNCRPLLRRKEDLATGQVLSMITPDAERTMRTFLGASMLMNPADLSVDDFAGAKVAMVEGYSLFNPELGRAIIETAKAAGCKVALDFASFEVVQASRDLLKELVAGPIDIVFLNEDEAAAWHEDGPMAALHDLAPQVDIAVVKFGKDGAKIMQDGQLYEVGCEPVEAVRDTTGAGDTWAAGFLAGYLRNLPPAACGELAALSAAAVVQQLGATVPAGDWVRLRGWLDAWA